MKEKGRKMDRYPKQVDTNRKLHSKRWHAIQNKYRLEKKNKDRENQGSRHLDIETNILRPKERFACNLDAD